MSRSLTHIVWTAGYVETVEVYGVKQTAIGCLSVFYLYAVLLSLLV